MQSRPRHGQEPDSLQEPRDKGLETETESSGVKAAPPWPVTSGAEKVKPG